VAAAQLETIAAGVAPKDVQPYSVWWWLQRLEAALVARIPDINRCEAYYEGHHNLAFATSKFRESFGRLFREFSDNWCELVVDSSVERISVQGFRFNEEDLSGDDAAWKIWQANNLDSESLIAFTTSVKTGTAYLLVGPGEKGENDVMMPEVTVEHPCEVITSAEPGNRRRQQAGLKRWVDDLGFMNAVVYLPDGVYTFRSERPVSGPASGPAQWLFEDSIRNPLGVVPIVPLPNNPDGRGVGTSDIAQVIPTQDAVNKLIADMMVSSEFNAFAQRWMTGIEVEADDPATQKMVSDLVSGAMRVWSASSSDAKFGAFPETNLEGFVAGIELIIQHIAARTRTPPHYLLGQSGNFPSGDSLKATETGLVAKVRKKHIFFGEALTDAMRLAFKLRGDSTKAADVAAKTLWTDPESRSFGELVDGLVKLATIGVPEEFLWQKAGYSPQEIARMQELQAVKLEAEAAANAKAAQQATPAQVPLEQPATGVKNPNAELVTGLPAAPTSASAQVTR
jgi:hypothetical protein